MKTDAGSAETTRAAGEAIVLSDPIGFVVDRLVSLGPEVKVKIHDEQWADVSFEGDSIEQIIRGLRKLAEATKRALSSEKPENAKAAPQESLAGSLVDKLSPASSAAASFCLAADSKLYVDAIPMALRAYLANFVEEICGVPALKATLTAGICAEIRSSESYVPNT